MTSAVASKFVLRLATPVWKLQARRNRPTVAGVSVSAAA